MEEKNWRRRKICLEFNWNEERTRQKEEKEGVFVFRRLHPLALGRIGGRQHEAAVHRQRQRGGEEERDGDHVRRVVVEVQVLVADVRHPVEVRQDPVREPMSPRSQQQRPEDHQRDIGENCEAEGERHMVADAELAADFHLSQRP